MFKENVDAHAFIIIIMFLALMCNTFAEMLTNVQQEKQRSAAYTGVDTYQSSLTFDCPLKHLQELVATHGKNAYERLQDEYQGIHGLCRRLHTSPTDGMVHFLNLVVVNC